MNDRSISPMIRLARLVRPRRNSLRRGIDRLEGAVLAVIVLIGLMLVPILLALGSLTYTNLAETAAREAEERAEVGATLTENAPAASIPTPEDGSSSKSAVPAEWRTPDGARHTGRVWAEDGLRAGAKVDVWVDEKGRLVDEPTTSSDALLTAAVTGVIGWLAAAGLLVFTQLRLHRMFNRRRFHAWTQEWARVEPEWSKRHRRPR
ncbi:hypothetical protein [Actinophytocola sp.]|uniref:Rv1733c family protein n=1 Tax=Actinophytocola sp. TaxID=1872138 RepID=UPI00389B39B0